MALWDTKNDAIQDIQERGVIAPYVNANGTKTMKKNESAELLVKINAQMIKLLDAIGIEPAQGGDAGDDEEM